MNSEDVLFELLQLRLEINDFGTKQYYNDKNKLHREFGPARIYVNGDKAWYLNGMLHCTDGPAVIYADIEKQWWVNDQRHRTDGPAIEWANGDKVWYLNGEKLTEKEFLKHPLCTVRKA